MLHFDYGGYPVGVTLSPHHNSYPSSALDVIKVRVLLYAPRGLKTEIALSSRACHVMPQQS